MFTKLHRQDELLQRRCEEDQEWIRHGLNNEQCEPFLNISFDLSLHLKAKNFPDYLIRVDEKEVLYEQVR